MASSYNNWPASPDPNAIGINRNFSVCGSKPFASGGFAGGIKSGDVEKLFTYLIEQLHTRVEPMMKEGGNIGFGGWGYSYRANVNNPSTLSCHASGTAIDYNATKHPNGTSTGPNGGGGWSGSQYNTIQTILRECSGAIRWLSGNDPMHFEIYGSASQVSNAVKKLGIPPKPLPPKDWFDTVTKDEMMQLLAPMNAAIQECQVRLRGADTGPGQRHEHFDMLQGIDSDTHDTQRRVRGMDTNAGQKHEHYDMLQGIDDALRAVKGYGDDPAQYPYAAAFKSLTDRVYELTIKED